MPELPEVETIARMLRERIRERIIEQVIVARADFVRTGTALAEVLPRRRVEEVWRRAKRIVVSLSPAGQLVLHLGMSGRITVEPVDAPLEPHTHVRVRFIGIGWEMRFRDPRRFGGVWYFADHEAPLGDRLTVVGIEPLDARLSDFRRLIDRRRQIKALLMDQSVIAGLGNIYCDESLFAAGIHPLRAGNTLSDEESTRLLRAIKSVLRRAIQFNGSTLVDYRDADGQPGSFQRLHRVYQRDGKPCKRCGASIERLKVNGRSTFVCARCQPRSRRRASV